MKKKTTPPRQPKARGRPAIPLPAPLCVIERRLEVYDRDGRLSERVMFIPAYWPLEASRPALFPADPRTPFSGGHRRGTRRYRMFTRRHAAVVWLLHTYPRVVLTMAMTMAGGVA